ncbi:carboxylesterase family protein [Clostridium sp.]|uniref:carboxylesterase family protein n=1 Tax=Clostridium sp. TaxID=1506 RepID=UPI00260B6D74|nr:dienelactone hydrolase family protein [uncultured Clostridium sp.]
MKAYNVDESKTYLTGISMGGYGTWALSMACPDKFAAIAPICGGGMAWYAGALNKMPVWAFHGANDDVVSLSESKNIVNAIVANEGSVKYTVYPDAYHDSWTETYNNPELYTWLLQRKKDKGLSHNRK